MILCRFVCVGFLIGLFASSSMAADFNVSDDAGLQSALTTAQANGQADTITITAGTYNGPFMYTADVNETFGLTITGSEPASTIIDGGGSDRGLFIDLQTFRPGQAGQVAENSDAGATILVEGITFRNGAVDTSGAGGLTVETADAAVTVRECEFRENIGADAGGLLVFAQGGSAVLLEDSVFTANAAVHSGTDPEFDPASPQPGGTGGGARLHSGVPTGSDGAVAVVDNRFEGNTSHGAEGGGLWARAREGVTVTGNVFVNNAARGLTDAAKGADSLVELNEGGGASVQADGVDTLEAIMIVGNTFQGNEALAGEGGGLYAKADAGRITLRDNTFSGNTAGFSNQVLNMGWGGSSSADPRPDGGLGGGAHVLAKDASGNGGIDLVRNDFLNNTADREGGGLNARTTAGSAPSVIINNTFFDNTAAGGGPNFAPDTANNAGTVAEAHGGGARYFTLGDVDVINNSWRSNKATADRGGGVSIKAHGAGTVNIHNNIVWGNAAGVDGDDIHIDDAEQLSDGNFSTVATVNVVNNDFIGFRSVCLSATNCPDQVHLTGNLAMSPLLAGGADFHLLAQSPMIDAGDPAAPSLPAADFEGDPRDAAPDIGADEFEGGGGAGFMINAGISGSWFDPNTNGQGWLLEILTLPTKATDGTDVPGLAVMYWFTFPQQSKGVAAEQAWVVGVGTVQEDTITFEDAQITSGGVFGPGFDPDSVVRTTWGDLTMIFDDCDTGTMSYVSKGGGAFGAGELPMKRITSVDGLDCTTLASHSGKVNELNPSFSGSWFDPDHDGEGWLIEVLPGGQAVVYWFSYDGDGNQAWFVGVGEISGKTITVEEVFIARGTVFGPGFDPDDVSLVPWGFMEFTFDSCSTGTMSYASTKGGEFGSGSLEMERITSLAGLPCTE